MPSIDHIITFIAPVPIIHTRYYLHNSYIAPFTLFKHTHTNLIFECIARDKAEK